MNLKLIDISADALRAARPRLIGRVTTDGVRTFCIEPRIDEDDSSFDEVFDEGFDPDGSPLARPVYWRIVRRGNQKFYLSTAMATRDEATRVWGEKALSHCDPVAGIAVIQFETMLPEDLGSDGGIR